MKSEVLGVDIGLLTAAHELKSPLSLLRQLALSLELSDDPSKITSQMVAISEKALREVEDLLKVARLEDNLFGLEPINPRSICDAALASAGSNSANEVKITYRNRHHLAIASPPLLQSIVQNLLSNARKYGDTTCLSVQDHRGTLRISVRDQGPALPTSIYRAINQSQITAPLPTPLRPGSSGLGLFISTRFAAHMHAPLTATRHRDGTSFHLDLPVSRQLTLC